MTKYQDSLKLKKSLIVINISLMIFTIILLIFGILVVQPKQLDKLAFLEQYMYFDITGKPRNIDVQLTDDVPSLQNKEQNKVSNRITNRVSSTIETLPRLSIIVTNLGLNVTQIERALSLPKTIALGFLPYTSTLKSLMFKAKEDGHEIYMSLFIDNNYEHVYNMSSNSSIEENIKKLNSILSAHTEYQGVYVNSVLDSTRQTKLINKISQELLKKQQIVITKHNSSRTNLIMKNGLLASLVIEHELDDGEITKKLNSLIDIAKENGTALAYIQGYGLAINCLRDWLKTIKDHEVLLVPVSELLRS